MKRLMTTLMLAAFSLPVLAEDAKEAVNFRKAAVGGTGRAALALKAIKDGKLEDDRYAEIAGMMVANAKATKIAFSHDTRGSDVETNARDAIWENWDDFEERVDALIAYAEEVEGLAQAGEIDAMYKVLLPGMRTHCGGCHKKYQKD